MIVAKKPCCQNEIAFCCIFTSQLVIRIVSIYDKLIKLLLLFQSDEVSPPDAPRIKPFEGNHSETVIFIAT